MAQVILQEGDRLDAAIRAFKRQVMKSGILKDLRRKRFYTKPSTAKRLKAAAARRRIRSEERRNRSR
jgi:small subunit ribosomal protein S21